MQRTATTSFIGLSTHGVPHPQLPNMILGYIGVTAISDTIVHPLQSLARIENTPTDAIVRISK